MDKKAVKVIYLPCQYDTKAFMEGCMELVKLALSVKEGGQHVKPALQDAQKGACHEM